MHRNKWKLKHKNPKPLGFSKLATHSSNLAWKIPRKKEPGGLQSMRLQSQAWLSNNHSVKAVLKGRFIAIQIYLKKQERNQINNLTLHLKQLEKEEMKNPRVSRRKFSSVQSLSRVRLFATPWIAARQASLSITNSRSLLKLMSIKSVMPSSHLILCHPILLLPPISPSIRVFSNESTLPMRWPMYWSFSFSISPSSEHSGLISVMMDWLDFLAVQGTLKSPLQHHSSKALNFQHSVFFTVHHDHWKKPWPDGPLLAK